tara:strand:- start:1196 stop:1462 length:267 start_codon:yes stop_codon:yes gene_type:complete
MPHYKDNQNKLHWIDSSEFESYLPAGCIQITDDDAEALHPVYTSTYAEKRAAEYPPMTDYLDGVVKGDQAQIDAYIAACLAVKAKYPK